MSVQEFFGMRDPVGFGPVCWLCAGRGAIFLSIIKRAEGAMMGGWDGI